MPFFNQIFVEKHSGMLMLAKIYSLLFKDEACCNSSLQPLACASEGVCVSSPTQREGDIYKNKVAILYLAYNISSSGTRRLPLISRVLAVTGLEKVDPLLSTYAQRMVEDISSDALVAYAQQVNNRNITLS